MLQFAILHRAQEIKDLDLLCGESEASVLGLWNYLLFLILYSIVAVISGYQLSRILTTTGCTQYVHTSCRGCCDAELYMWTS